MTMTTTTINPEFQKVFDHDSYTEPKEHKLRRYKEKLEGEQKELLSLKKRLVKTAKVVAKLTFQVKVLEAENEGIEYEKAQRKMSQLNTDTPWQELVARRKEEIEREEDEETSIIDRL